MTVSREQMLALADRAEGCLNSRNNAYPSDVLRECIAALRSQGGNAAGVQMHTDLRRLAIAQHQRPAYGGAFVNNGKSCRVCKGEWADDAPEFHAKTCTAQPEPPTPQSGQEGVREGVGLTVSDEDWQAALDCAYSCVDPKFISRSALDNAMQHAFGLLALRRLASPAGSEASSGDCSRCSLPDRVNELADTALCRRRGGNCVCQQEAECIHHG